jgi:hypothetical protein
MTGKSGKSAGASTRRAPAPPSARRRALLLAAAGLVVVVAAALFWVLGADEDELSSTAAAGSSSSTAAPAASTAAGTPAPTPVATGPTSDVDEPPPALLAVPLDGHAAVGNGIVATIPGIDAIQGTAVGLGNVAGPALRVTVRIENGSGVPVSLDGVAVNLAYGPDAVPASPLGDASQRPFAGMLAPGESAEGVYVFRVPSDARSSVTIEVGYQAGAPLLLFTGPVE